MKVLALAVGGLGALVAQDVDADASGDVTESRKYDAGGAMERVVNLLTEYKTKLDADEVKDKRMYDQFACFCKEESDGRTKRIEKSKSRLQELTTSIQNHGSHVLAAQAVQRKQEKIIDESNKELAQIKARIEKLTTDFNVRKAELTETIETLRAALEALGWEGFEKMQAAKFLQKKVSEKDLALLSTLTGKSVNVANMGQATGYLAQMLKASMEDLKEETQEYETETKNLRKRAEEVTKEKQAAERLHNKKKVEEAKHAEQKAADEKEYATTKKLLEEDDAYYTSLVDDCKTRSIFYGKQVISSQTESNAIKMAIAALTTQEDKQDSHSPPGGLFTQIESNTARNSLAQGLVSKCNELITGLEGEIADVETEKKRCRTSRQDNTQALKKAINDEENATSALEDAKNKQAQYEDLEAHHDAERSATVETMKQTVSNYKAVQQQLQNEIELGKLELAQLDNARTILAGVFGIDATDSMQAHEHSKADYNNKFNKMAGGDSKEEQKTDFTDHKARRAGGFAILEMVRQIWTELNKSVENMKAEKKTSTDDYNVQIKDLDVSRLASKRGQDEAAGDASTWSGTVQTNGGKLLKAGTDVMSAQGQLNNEECGTTDDHFNQKIQARYIDIQGLKDVIGLLSGNQFEDMSGPKNWEDKTEQFAGQSERI